MRIKKKKLSGKQFFELLHKNGITNIYNSGPLLTPLLKDRDK